MSDDIVEKLDDILSVLKLAFSEQITRARQSILGDKINASIFETIGEDWFGSGDLQRRVAVATGASERTIRDRLADLGSRGALRSRGAGRALEYRRTRVL